MEGNQLIQSFFKIYRGYEKAYTSVSDFKKKENGKIETSVLSRKGTISIEEMKEHLFGNKKSLGIIPLKEDDSLSFAVIDIDIINNSTPLRHSLKEMEEKVKRLNLPLIVCRSKSGGAHLCIFFKENISASYVIEKLKKWAGSMGYGGAEIFPKQSKRANSLDIGNAINLPYFNSEDTERWAINNGKKIGLEKFIKLVDCMKVSQQDLANTKMDENTDEEYKDAPPCIEMLLMEGIEEGCRNNGLYNLGVFFKKKYLDNFQEKLMEANGKIIKPPLESRAIDSIIKGLSKKDYFYKCDEYPLCQFCNKEECRKRTHGLKSSGGNSFLFSNLTKYIAKGGGRGSVRWCISFDGERSEIDTEELFCQTKLQRRIAEDVHKIYRPMKQQKWIQDIEKLMSENNIIIDPEDSSEKGQFSEILDSFLTDRKPSLEKRALLEGGTYLDKETNLIYFRSIELMTFLKNKKFAQKTKMIWSWISDAGGKNGTIYIGGKNVKVWYMGMPVLYDEQLDKEVKV